MHYHPTAAEAAGQARPQRTPPDIKEDARYIKAYRSDSYSHRNTYVFKELLMLTVTLLDSCAHTHTDTQTHTQMNNHTQMHNAYNCKIISSLRLSPSSACPSRHFVSLHLLLQRALETTIVLTSYILNPNQCSINTKSHTHTKQPLQFQRATVFAGR